MTELQIKVQPSLDTLQEVLANYEGSPNPPNVVPLCAIIPADILTPTLAYLKISVKSVYAILVTAVMTHIKQVYS